MTVSIGLGRVGSNFFSLVVVWVGLGRVTQNGPMDNSDFSAPNCILIAAPHATCRPHWTKNARPISDQRVYPADNPAGKQQKAL